MSSCGYLDERTPNAGSDRSPTTSPTRSTSVIAPSLANLPGIRDATTLVMHRSLPAAPTPTLGDIDRGEVLNRPHFQAAREKMETEARNSTSTDRNADGTMSAKQASAQDVKLEEGRSNVLHNARDGQPMVREGPDVGASSPMHASDREETPNMPRATCPETGRPGMFASNSEQMKKIKQLYSEHMQHLTNMHIEHINTLAEVIEAKMEKNSEDLETLVKEIEKATEQAVSMQSTLEDRSKKIAGMIDKLNSVTNKINTLCAT